MKLVNSSLLAAHVISTGLSIVPAVSTADAATIATPPDSRAALCATAASFCRMDGPFLHFRTMTNTDKGRLAQTPYGAYNLDHFGEHLRDLRTSHGDHLTNASDVETEVDPDRFLAKTSTVLSDDDGVRMVPLPENITAALVQKLPEQFGHMAPIYVVLESTYADIGSNVLTQGYVTTLINKLSANNGPASSLLPKDGYAIFARDQPGTHDNYEIIEFGSEGSKAPLNLKRLPNGSASLVGAIQSYQADIIRHQRFVEQQRQQRIKAMRNNQIHIAHAEQKRVEAALNAIIDKSPVLSLEQMKAQVEEFKNTLTKFVSPSQRALLMVALSEPDVYAKLKAPSSDREMAAIFSANKKVVDNFIAGSWVTLGQAHQHAPFVTALASLMGLSVNPPPVQPAPPPAPLPPPPQAPSPIISLGDFHGAMNPFADAYAQGQKEYFIDKTKLASPRANILWKVPAALLIVNVLLACAVLRRRRKNRVAIEKTVAEQNIGSSDNYSPLDNIRNWLQKDLSPEMRRAIYESTLDGNHAAVDSARWLGAASEKGQIIVRVADMMNDRINGTKPDRYLTPVALKQLLQNLRAADAAELQVEPPILKPENAAIVAGHFGELAAAIKPRSKVATIVSQFKATAKQVVIGNWHKLVKVAAKLRHAPTVTTPQNAQNNASANMLADFHNYMSNADKAGLLKSQLNKLTANVSVEKPADELSEKSLMGIEAAASILDAFSQLRIAIAVNQVTQMASTLSSLKEAAFDATLAHLRETAFKDYAQSIDALPAMIEPVDARIPVVELHPFIMAKLRHDMLQAQDKAPDRAGAIAMPIKAAAFMI